MNERHPLYTRILEKLIDLDQRDFLPNREHRLVEATKYLVKEQDNTKDETDEETQP